MANINLIAARRAERVRLTKIAKGLIGAIGVTVVVGTVSAAMMTVRVVMVRGEIAGIDRELATLAPIRKEIEANEKERLVLQPKLAALGEARKRTRRWYDIMEGLKRAVPEETWLNSLSVEVSPDANQSIRLDGTTTTQERVGETMLRMAQQPEYFKKVDLRFTQANRTEYGEVVSFELASQLQPLDPPVEEGKKDAPKAN
jgi:Tfp pilus assembly protein PilN